MIKIEPCKDFDNVTDTEALILERDDLLSIEEMIELLTFAKKRYGNIKIMVHDFNSNVMGGINCFYLHKQDEYTDYDGEVYPSENVLTIFT